METLILLDVDGVLNPTITRPSGEEHPSLTLDNRRKEILTDLARLGTIAWATSHDAAITNQLDKQTGLTGTTLRIPLTGFNSDEIKEPTPKLGRIIRWIYRMQIGEEFPWKRIIWIDDQHGSDATEWAVEADLPTLLVTPNPSVGLSPTHLQQAREWVNQQAHGTRH